MGGSGKKKYLLLECNDTIQFQCRKSMEGSAAMFIGQILVHWLLFGSCGPTSWLVYALCTLSEASMHQGDNIFLPIIGYFSFRFIDLIFLV